MFLLRTLLLAQAGTSPVSAGGRRVFENLGFENLGSEKDQVKHCCAELIRYTFTVMNLLELFVKLNEASTSLKELNVFKSENILLDMDKRSRIGRSGGGVGRRTGEEGCEEMRRWR